MLEVTYKGQFKRDLKRYRHDRRAQVAIHEVLTQLKNGQPLPAKHREHLLIGQYEGSWECHCLPDVVLIYDKSDTGVILFRLGSHAELF
jgi:mRNA interferase YafQ